MTRGLGLALLLALCGSCDPATRGELGAARFRYDGGLYGCLRGCDADEPIAEGAIVDVLLANGADLPSCAASSSAPEILGWAGECDSALRGEAITPGSAALILTRDLDGGLLDRLSFDVAATETIELGDEGDRRPFLVATGGTARLLARPLDARGKRLVGVGGVAFSAAAPLDAAVTLVSARAFVEAGSPIGSVQDFVDVLAGPTPAAGALCAEAPSGAAACADSAVVGATDVASISLWTDPRHPHAGAPWFVEAYAATAAGDRVRSPACAWSWSPAEAAAYDGDPGRDTATLLLADGSGGTTVTVTCVVGSARAELSRRVRE